MSRPANMNERILQETRLIMLRELAGQVNGRITSSSMADELREVWGVDRERQWVEGEFAWLEEAGAITVVPAGSVKIACITEKGRRHLRFTIAIPGIRRPSEPVDC